MSSWPSTKANRVLAALLRIGWVIKRQSGTSRRVLSRPGWPDLVFAFRDSDEIGPRMLARIAKHQTGGVFWSSCSRGSPSGTTRVSSRSTQSD